MDTLPTSVGRRAYLVRRRQEEPELTSLIRVSPSGRGVVEIKPGMGSTREKSDPRAPGHGPGVKEFPSDNNVNFRRVFRRLVTIPQGEEE